MTDFKIHPASYKDPAGFVFLQEGHLFRQVNQSYASQYNHLMESGLYELLTGRNWLVSHQEVDENLTGSRSFYKTLSPEQLSFTSYPYEWSFDMLKDAALLTLNINKTAIEYGMILKDATPYNIQFYKGKPIFIDTLSFEKYDESKPWIAYRQFCEMFLFPLYFEHYLKTDINKILSTYTDGIPVDLTAKLLPLRSSFSIGVWLHVHLQNTIKKKKKNDAPQPNFDKTKLKHLLEHLQTIIESFKSRKSVSSIWSNYYQDSILSKEYLHSKEEVFRSFIEGVKFKRALDLGANDGYFSNILSEVTNEVIAIDFDSQCINQLYRQLRKKDITNILPLAVDLANPSPAIGFNNSERQPFLHRAPSDLVNALALIHHLVFSKNIRLDLLADFFRELCTNYLVIEFVPISDEKVQQLIANKHDVHMPYDEESFEAIFSVYFDILKKKRISESSRTLYLMKKLN